MPHLSVILPLYRTADALEELLARLCATLEAARLTFEIIAVDDACPHGSGDRLTFLAARDPRVVPVHLACNVGQQRAVWRGLQSARGEHIAIMDADLQDEPEHLPALLQILASRPVHAVFAGRRGHYQQHSRMATSYLFKRLLHLIAHVPPDAGSYVVMTRAMANSVLRFQVPNPYMLALIGATRLPVTSIPVPRASRPNGHSAYSEWTRLQFAWRGLRTAVATRLQNRGTSWITN